MLRALVVAVGLLVWSAADADPRAVEQVVKTHLTGLAQLDDDEQLGLAGDAIVIDPHGQQVDLASEDGCVSGAVANAFYGCLQAEIAHKPGAITIGVDAARGVAWFQAPYTATFTSDDEDGKPRRSKQPMRIGGIAVRQGGGWQIVATMHVEPLSDKALLASASPAPAPAPPTRTGDAGVTTAVAGWFGAGLTAAAAKDRTLVVSGTAPAEYQTGAGALKLVKRWDALGLRARTIDARVLAGGAIAWARVDVLLPRKGSKDAVAMTLVVVAVPDGKAWRWVSLQFQGPPQIGR